MKIVLGVSHCPGIPERAASLHRLRSALGVLPNDVSYFEVTDKAHVSVWSEIMWRRALEKSGGVGHCAFLQDDDIIVPDGVFLAAMSAILTAVPGELLGLHLHHPGAVQAAKDGERFVTTMSCVGVGYALPAVLLADFLRWREHQSVENVYRTSEDTLLDAWAIHRHRRVWHPVPAIVKPDASLASTGGGGGRDDADDQYMRDCVLSWEGFDSTDMSNPAWWCAGLRDPPRHLVFAGIARPGVSRADNPATFDGHAVRPT